MTLPFDRGAKQPSPRDENDSKNFAANLRRVLTWAGITKSLTDVLTRWPTLEAPDLMEGWELRTGIQMIILVIIIDELHPTVLTPGQSVRQNMFSSPVHCPKGVTYPSCMRCICKWHWNACKLSKMSRQPSLSQRMVPSSRTRPKRLGSSWRVGVVPVSLARGRLVGGD